MGDQVYQPDGSEVQDDIGPLEPEDTLEDRGLDSALDEGYAPPERPLGVRRHGVTAAEQRVRESLDQRLAEELPEVAAPDGDGIGDCYGTDGEPLDPEAGEVRTGRLVLSAGSRSDLIAEDVGISGGAASAEEAAMHTTDDPEAVIE
ncbi:DUF5709 domain-containing protein [Streptomyces rubellomurinus]|uniref:DUF5709 domain-containing protein n=2 Tax=Streptomyces TaxID=1883 RepID=A0A0F2TDM1_STRR3|nr:DUF5709 domain-containing protein [Streptomyces rubellomurinus]KJS59847.1 hypothetical protein VM95_24585 [Streptomyces rubellomurinus]